MHVPATHRPRLRGRLAAIPVALGLASVILAALPAATSAAIHPDRAVRRTAEVRAEPSSVARVTARCPKGMVAISGGASFRGPGLEPGSGILTFLTESSPTLNGRGWRGAGIASQESLVPSDPEVWLRVVVLCRPASEVGRYTVVTRERRSKDEGIVSLGADCGRGRRIVTGGAHWTRSGLSEGPSGWNLLIASTPLANARAWQASGYTAGGTVDTLRVVLLCRPAGALADLRVRTRAFPVTSDEERAYRVACPAGTRALAGGLQWFQGSDPLPGGVFTATQVTGDRKAWSVKAHAEDTSVTARVRVLCLPA